MSLLEIFVQEERLEERKIFPGFNEAYVRYFCPHMESIDDLSPYIDFKGKSILVIAGYGYGFSMLHEGADKVIAIDVDSGQIAWNHMIRSSLDTLSFSQAREFMEGQIKFLDRVLQGMPKRYQSLASRCYEDFTDGETSHVIKSSNLECYPHLRSADEFGALRDAVREGRLLIIQNELKEFLQHCQSRFDIISASSVRYWAMYHYAKTDLLVFQEYDSQLAKNVDAHLNPNGVFCDAIYEMGEEFQLKLLEELQTWSLQFTIHSTLTPNMRLALGRKAST